MGFRDLWAPATGHLQKFLGLLCQAACLLYITIQLSGNSDLQEIQIPGLSTPALAFGCQATSSSFSPGTQTCGLSQRE